MTPRAPAARIAALAGLALSLVLTVSARDQSTPLPSPTEFFGFPMGAENRLASWDAIVEYFQVVDAASDRVLVQELGKTTLGRPYIMAIVSAADTLTDLARHREQQHRLADPRATPADEARELARRGKAVVLVSANVHSTEIGSSQMVNDLVYRLATEHSPSIRHVLDNVILLLIPSQNPDGQQMVVEWHEQNLATPYAHAPLPELYHRYAGHDNNRDAYMLTQVETQYFSRVAYRDWLPEVVLDLHQMGNRGARIFVPPFKNPPNPNIDPLVWSQVNLLGQTMAARLHAEGKTGVIWGEQYTGFWQGANSTNPWWHNMTALLVEVASARLAATVHQDRLSASRTVPGVPSEPTLSGLTGRRSPSVSIAPPTDTQFRMTYPQPWLGGSWRFSDVVDYHLSATLGLLEGVANNREMLKRNFHLMSTRTIEAYADGSPFAFVVPPAQRDPVAAAKLLSLIQAGGAEVHRAGASFTADAETFDAGTHVVLLAQPFGRWVKDLLEPQHYPEIRWPDPATPVDRPYDATAWTLGMFLGVETIQIDHPFDAPLILEREPIEADDGAVNGHGNIFVLRHESSNVFTAMNRLLRLGAEVAWAREPVDVNGHRRPTGSVIVTDIDRERMDAMAQELKLSVDAIPTPPPVPTLRIPAPRIALFEPWGGNIDAGWTRWVLEQYEFPYTHVRNAALRTDSLRDRFDVIIVPEMSTAAIVRGLRARNVPPQYRGGIGRVGIRNLRTFLEDGGTVVTLGSSADFAIDSLEVPLENTVRGLDSDTFFGPGSILRIEVDTEHPIGYGMPREADAMFVRNGVYRPTGAATTDSITPVASYPARDLLRSGWIIGESRLHGAGAILEATVGRGRVILHTFRVQNRAQTLGTFKLLFNSLFYGPAVAGAPATVTVDQDLGRP